MLHFPARRYHRPLLFPPGLLALGFLLLLGCLALRPWYEVLKTRYIMQLTLPLKPTSDFIYPVIFLDNEELEKLKEYILETNPNTNESLQKYSQLAHFRPWQDFAFTGVPEQDAATGREVHQALRAMQADTMYARSLRIRFSEQATYASLVRSLDWTNAATKKYLLDIHHDPVTLYAFTDAYKLPSNEIMLECGTANYQPAKHVKSFEVQMQNWLTRWQQAWSEAFSSSVWQLPILFLLGIMAVNCWKMARRWHTA